MAPFRLATPARRDLSHIIGESRQGWGDEAARRYTLLLDAAMNHVAAEPYGPLTRDCARVRAGLRSFHVRHARRLISTRVDAPPHLIYFRVIEGELVEIVGVLHERMDPALHIVPDNDSPGDRR
jgi:toxin ParE1/3/4